MQTTFTVRGKDYSISLQKQERGEKDKFNPYGAQVSGQDGGPVDGVCQLTDEALEAVQANGGDSPDSLLARACAQAVTAELVIRKLQPGFSFIVDPRWVSEVLAPRA